jgi:hypothetical protein
LVEKQRNQNPSDAAITIFEGVQEFKLGMNDRRLKQEIDIVAVLYCGLRPSTPLLRLCAGIRSICSLDTSP